MKRKRRPAVDALLVAEGLINNMCRERGPVAFEIAGNVLTRLHRAIGSMIPGNALHDRGALARCSGCGRYTTCSLALSERAGLREPCDCGRRNYWSGSFKPPGPDARWSFGVHRFKAESEELVPFDLNQRGGETDG